MAGPEPYPQEFVGAGGAGVAEVWLNYESDWAAAAAGGRRVASGE